LPHFVMVATHMTRDAVIEIKIMHFQMTRKLAVKPN